MRQSLVLKGLLAGSLVTGLSWVAGGGVCFGATTVHVFAAASLAEVFGEAKTLFESRNPSARVELNLAGSQALETQVEQGAVFDVVAMADLGHADALARAGLVEAYRVFARNSLVVVVPKDQTEPRSLRDLGRPGVKVVLAQASVPAGHYARAVIAKMGGTGDDIERRILGNVVSEETNVRAVLAKVALGEADAGFVYWTDAFSSDRVRTIEIPEDKNVVAEYPIAIAARSADPALAKTFVDLILGEEGRAILRRAGFKP